MSSVQFILLSGVIEGIFGAIFSLILIAVFLVGGTMLASWIFGSSIGSGYNRRNVIHPNDLPDLVKGLSRISERFKGKTKSEIENLSSIIYNKTDTSFDKFMKIEHLKKSGVINDEEYEILKKEIFSGND